MKTKSNKPSHNSPKSQPKAELAGHLGNRRNFLLGVIASSCAWLMPKSAQATLPAWHLPDGTFRNNYGGPINKTFADLRKAFSGDRPPLLEFPVVANDPSMLQANRSETTVTWIGHCTILLQVGGLNILTDPQFSQRASPVSFLGPKRGTPPGLNVADLPPLDIIFLSHNHYDHLDSGSMQQLAAHSPGAEVFVPLGLGNWFKGFNFAKINELDWWGETTLAGARITAVPSQHWSRRSGFDRNKSLWCGWAVHLDDFSFLFIGDSGYSQDFRDINERLGNFDLAAIPIGAYNPRWFMQDVHQNPEEAVQCLHDLGARRGLATHWGTFMLTFEPMDEPPQRLATALAAAGRTEDDFWVLQHGETRSWT